MPETVTVRVNGANVEVPANTSAAAAILLSSGFSRTSVMGERRSAFCGMGTCFECRCEINGESHTRGCQVLCEHGMEIRTDSGASPEARAALPSAARPERLHFQVVVVGGGPAGIAAAVAAAESGRSVAVLDDNLSPGGQTWRGENGKSSTAGASEWLRRLRQSPVQIIPRARIFHLENNGLAAETDRGVLELSCRDLILATGARELFLPFPGWTLQGVFGAGGLQALMKTGLPVAGKRIVVAGTGPLLLAVASYARNHGAKVAAVCEQTDAKKLARFGMATMRTPGKLKDAVRFGWDLRGISYWTNCWPVAASGRERLESVRLSRSGRIREVECDYLACGFHLIPNLELPKLIACAIENEFVRVDELQQTSLPHVYCAGEATGIGGLDKSLVEGRIAGYAATGNEHAARRLFGERTRHARFASEMKSAFELRAELKSLATPDTLLCRCEDVAIGRASQFGGWRAAKLHTRCGMGPCQGRVCGAATEFLFGWSVDAVRPPAFAVKGASLAAVAAAEADRDER